MYHWPSWVQLPGSSQLAIPTVGAGLTSRGLSMRFSESSTRTFPPAGIATEVPAPAYPSAPTETTYAPSGNTTDSWLMARAFESCSQAYRYMTVRRRYFEMQSSWQRKHSHHAVESLERDCQRRLGDTELRGIVQVARLNRRIAVYDRFLVLRNASRQSLSQRYREPGNRFSSNPRDSSSQRGSPI